MKVFPALFWWAESAFRTALCVVFMRGQGSGSVADPQAWITVGILPSGYDGVASWRLGPQCMDRFPRRHGRVSHCAGRL